MSFDNAGVFYFEAKGNPLSFAEIIINTIERHFKYYDGDHNRNNFCVTIATAQRNDFVYDEGFSLKLGEKYINVGVGFGIITLDEKRFYRMTVYVHKLTFSDDEMREKYYLFINDFIETINPIYIRVSANTDYNSYKIIQTYGEDDEFMQINSGTILDMDYQIIYLGKKMVEKYGKEFLLNGPYYAEYVNKTGGLLIKYTNTYNLYEKEYCPEDAIKYLGIDLSWKQDLEK